MTYGQREGEKKKEVLRRIEKRSIEKSVEPGNIGQSLFVTCQHSLRFSVKPPDSDSFVGS
jgi:hypothetical protein